MPFFFYILLCLLSFSACKQGQAKKQAAASNPPRKEEPSLSKQEALELAQSLFAAEQERLRQDSLAEQWNKRTLVRGEAKMPFFLSRWGEKPADGYALYISLHGGGGTTEKVNNSQYENQKRLYDKTMAKLPGSIYIAPRAPGNTWDLWHRSNIDSFLCDIIRLAVLLEGVDPDKVYLLGYSAGGDGVYQLAPRLADRLAAAAMMAGHPNDAQPLSLHNTPFAIHMGEHDKAYNRNTVAQEWINKLSDLQRTSHKSSYICQGVLHKDKGHWMNLQDAMALPWMASFRRRALPDTLVKAYDKNLHEQFAWLGWPRSQKAFSGAVKLVLDRAQQSIYIKENPCDTLFIYLNDEMLDLDKELEVFDAQGLPFAKLQVQRYRSILEESLKNKGDEQLLFSARLCVVGSKVEEF